MRPINQSLKRFIVAFIVMATGGINDGYAQTTPHVLRVGTYTVNNIAIPGDYTDIQAAVDQFRAHLGPNNGIGGSFTSGRREITKAPRTKKRSPRNAK